MRQWMLGLVGLALVSGGATAETIERTIPANTRSAVGGIFTYEPHRCYAAPTTEAQISTPPANGTASVVMHEITLDGKSLCPGLKVKGPVIVYAPKRGFTGVDEFTVSYPYRRASDDLMATTVSTSIRVTVKEASAR